MLAGRRRDGLLAARLQQALAAGVMAHDQCHREHGDAQASVPLHPCADEQEERRPFLDRLQCRESGGGYPGDRFEPGIERCQPVGGQRIDHDQRGEDKGQGGDGEGLVPLDLARGGQTRK
jgi:hypothetical protein